MRPVSRALIGVTRMRGVLVSAMACAVGVTGIGCASGGSVEFVDLNFKRIPDGVDLVQRMAVDRATWWIDAGDVIRIALEKDAPVLFLAASGERLDMSIVVSGLPAAGSRDYKVTGQTFRACRHIGSNHARYASSYGIVALWFESSGVLRGRFRLIATKEIFHILTGWTKVGRVVAVGEFVARPDSGEGKKVLDRSEAGMKRGKMRNATSDGRPKPVRVDTSPAR